MEKYDFEYIKKFFIKFENKSKEISSILNKEEKLNIEEINSLIGIFNDREIIIKKIDSWFHSEDGKKFIQENPDIWNDKIGKIIETEKKTLQLLEKRYNQIGNQLRNLTKQKSVLIYSKDKKL